MKKTIILLITLLLIPMVMADFGIEITGTEWVTHHYSEGYDIEFTDKNSQKTTISFWSKTATDLQELPNHLDIICQEADGTEINIQLNRKQKDGKFGYERVVDNEIRCDFNPTVVYQDLSQVTYIERDLVVNATLKKWNGEEFVIAPEDIFIIENADGTKKFGANDNIAKERTEYKYEWVSNKPIKYDGYYYFDEVLSDNSYTHKNIYQREKLDLTDICAARELNCWNESEQLQVPVCNEYASETVCIDSDMDGNCLEQGPTYTDECISWINETYDTYTEKCDYSYAPKIYEVNLTVPFLNCTNITEIIEVEMCDGYTDELECINSTMEFVNNTYETCEYITVISSLTENVSCLYNLTNEYTINEDGFEVLDYSKLEVRFYADYDTLNDVIFIDPAYTHGFYSTDNLIEWQSNGSTINNVNAPSLEAPVVYMDFNKPNESGNYVQDNSIYNIFGTNNGATHNISCNSPIGDNGGCYAFSGTSQTIRIDEGAWNQKQQFSIGMWFYKESDLGSAWDALYNDVANNGGGTADIMFTTDHGGSGENHMGVHADTGLGSWDTEYTILLNTWYFVVLTVDTINNNMTIYLDGINIGSNAAGKITYGADPHNWIGGWDSNDHEFNGQIDDFYYWDRVLNADEIQQLYGIGIGGNITTDGDYIINTFRNDGTFTILNDITDVDVLVVAGGGGGGGSNAANRQGGGGGAGGMIENDSISLTAGTYTVTVGTGGTGGDGSGASAATKGGNSVFNGETAVGGGKGSSNYDTSAGSGGSGAGCGSFCSTAGTGTTGQGNAGSVSSNPGGNNVNSGGGGGANAAGAITAGGAGISNSITGSSVTYATGGDGINSGTHANGASGTDGEGDGGGAGGSTGAAVDGGDGGDGVVIIRYLNPKLNTTKSAGKYAKNGTFKSLVYYNDTSIKWDVNLTIAEDDYAETNFSKDSSLVAFWKFDQNFNDSKNNNEAIDGGTDDTLGIVGHARKWDGTNQDYVNITTQINSTNLTISFWAYDRNTNDDGFLMDSQSDRLVLVLARGETSSNIGMYDGAWKSFGKTSKKNAWGHYVFVLDGTNSNASLYVDNELHTTYLAYTQKNLGTAINLGHTFSSTGGGLFDGYIDEFMIFNRTLSQEEITQLFNDQNDYYGIGWGAYDGIGMNSSTLVSYWPLDESYDDVKGNNHGTPTGTNNGTGVSSEAIRFHGGPQDDRIDVGTAAVLNPTNNISMSSWIKTTDNTGTAWVIARDKSGGRSYALGLASGQINFQINGAGKVCSPTTTLNDGVWHHFVVIGDTSTGLDAYVDGYKVCDAAWAAPSTQAGTNVMIGNRGWLDSPWNGTIDEVMWFNRLLTTTEIRQLHKAGLSQHGNTNISLQTRTGSSYNTSDDNLVSLWGLNGDATDEKGVNDGTNNGVIFSGANGTVGKGAYFDGGDSITTSTATTFSGEGTIAGWVKREDISRTEYFFDHAGHDFLMILYPTNQISFYVNFGADSTDNLVLTNISWDTNWHHIVATADDTTNELQIFFDGVLMGSSSPDWSAATVNDFVFGKKGDSSEYYFKGSMDEIRVYNKTLTPTEIQNLYELGNYHIEWNDWNNKGKVSDNIITTSTNTGKLLQYRTTYSTSTTAISPYLLNSSISQTANSAPTVTDITWSTTGGFTDNTLVILQVMDFINATCTDAEGLSTCTLNLTKPDGTLALQDYQMTNFVGDLYTNGTDVTLDTVGVWNINVSACDTSGLCATNGTTFSVSTVNQTHIDGFYGYDTQTIPTNTTIENLATFQYNIIEINDTASGIQDNWSKVKTAIEKANSLNIKVGLKYYLDYSLGSDNVSRDNFRNNITANFTELITGVYLDTIEYIKIDATTGGTDDDVIIANMNVIGKDLFTTTNNEFVIYSNTNSTTLDGDYMQFAGDLYYVTAGDRTILIDRLANLTRFTTSKTRIYYNLVDNQKTVTQNIQNNIMVPMFDTPNKTTTLTDKLVSEIDGNGLIIYNNESTTKNFTYDVSSATTIVGKDVWDYTQGILVENNTDGTVTFLDIPAYSAILVGTEEISHIAMDSLTTATVFKSTANEAHSSNHTDGAREGASAASTTRVTELWPEDYISPTTMVYYGLLSSTEIISPSRFDGLTYLVIADKTDADVDKLFWDNVSITTVLGYVAVVDYVSTNVTWLDEKKAEIDIWLNLNESMNIFFDGLDAANVDNPSQFEIDMKNLTDYVKITKAREVAINVFTNYQTFAQYASSGGFAMKESCGHKWEYCDNGETNCDDFAVNSTTGYNYSNQYFEDFNGFGDYNKSIWYNTHNVPLVCVPFINRNNTAHIPDSANYTLMEKLYFKARVLGYEHIYMSSPHFNIAYYDKYYDVGTKLQSQPNKQEDLYSMRYTLGTVYYNSTADTAWFDDGLVYNNATLSLVLHDNGVFNYNICVDEYCDYTITTPGAGFSYNWYNITINKTVYDAVGGHYKINITSADGGFTGDDNNLSFDYHSFTQSGQTYTVFTNGNHMANLNINHTHKASIDTTNKITQTETLLSDTTTRKYNITLSSDYDFNTSVWTYNINKTGIFRNLQAWNTTDYVNLSLTYDTACLTMNPTWYTTAVLGLGDIGSCLNTLEQNISRVNFPQVRYETALLDMDDLPPTLSITSPTASSTSNGDPVYINGTAFDASGISNVSINDTRFTLNATGEDWSFINHTNIVDGPIVVNVSVNDSYNYITSSTLLFTWDNTAPTLTLISPAAGTGTNNLSYHFKYNITDITSDISVCDLIVDSTAVATDGTITKGITQELEYTFPSYGGYLWSINCTDDGGNVVNSSTRDILLITPQPESTPSGGGVTLGSTNANYYVNEEGELIRKQGQCQQQTLLLDRLQDSCKVKDGICSDAEIPIIDSDCAITPDSITCNGNRCIFEEIWFAKLALLSILGMALTKKRDYKVWIIILSLIILFNFIGLGGPL